jgi:predicted metalloprotease
MWLAAAAQRDAPGSRQREGIRDGPAPIISDVRVRVVLPVVIAGLLVSACGVPEPGVAATRSRQLEDEPLIGSGPDPDPGGDPFDTIEGVVDFGSNKPPQDHDAFMTVAIKDVIEFMNEIYPELYGEPFPPLEGGIYAAYPERPADEPIPGCGEPESNYDDVAGRGAFYCVLGDFVAYDDPFIASLVADLGLSGVGIVMAHEFGHSIQARQDNFGQPVILMEQQADCFAGAWAARVARGESDEIQFNDNDVRAGLIAMIQVRDPVDVDVENNPDAHGTGFDRVGAFQDGFTNGALACRSYFETPPELVPVAFDASDENQGNLPWIDDNPLDPAKPNDIVSLIPADLERFWLTQANALGGTFTAPALTRFSDGGALPECAGLSVDDIVNNIIYCPSRNELLVSDERAFSLADDPLTGDMSVGYLLSTGYGDSVLTQLGDSTAGEDRRLLTDCLTGAWTADIIPGRGNSTGKLLLSAGDLDEAIITAIAEADETSDTDINGGAFEKVASFRKGVLDGAQACIAG